MNEAKLYADNFGAAFFEENGFLHFLGERTDGGWWRREESRDLHFLALDDESEESGDYINECMCLQTAIFKIASLHTFRQHLRTHEVLIILRKRCVKSVKQYSMKAVRYIYPLQTMYWTRSFCLI